MKRNIKKYLHVTRSVVNGRTYKDVGKEMRISCERARQMFSFIMRASLRREFMPDPNMIPYHVTDVRKNKEYWLRQIDKVAKHYGIE